MDFIFGTLATDELKLVHHRAAQRGVQHNSAIFPRDPQPGDPVTISVTLGTDCAADYAACYYTIDGSEPRGACGIAENGQVIALEQVATEWDTLSWAYLRRCAGVIPPQPEGTVVRYRIGAWDGDGHETFANSPDVTRTVEAAADAFFHNKPLPTTFMPGDNHIFTYRVDTLQAPGWSRDAIIYHVFVDRFYPGDGNSWLQTDDLKELVGGTLWGVLQKLDYIEELGANCLWLSPIWVAPSHHGYDVIDYCQVESRLGGENALRALIDAAHARGMRVLLDLVCNHISSDHPIFQAALKDKDSPYRDWFFFDDSRIGYRTFFSVSSMPQINLAHPGAKAWMLDIARYWLREYGIDGYRLDYANGPVPEFWWDFRAACREVNPECFVFGEVVDAPDVVQTYVGRLDGCLDFFIGEAIRKTFAWKQLSEREFQQFAVRQRDYFPADFIMPSFIDNHDMDRFLFIAGGDKEALRRAATAQMALPNPPIIYYGTEVGLSQTVGTREGMGLHLSRTPMLWGDQQDRELLDYYKGLIRARKQN